MNEILKTKDYEKFTFNKLNRTINNNHVDRINKNMLKNGWVGEPIIINNKYEILSGQHRFLAAKKANIEIKYLIDDNYKSILVNELSCLVEKWKPCDRLEYFIKIKNENYIKFYNFINKYNIGISSGITIFSSNSGEGYRKFNSGEFIYPEKDFIQVQFVNFLDNLKNYKFYKQEHFISALWKLFNTEGFEMEKMLHKINMYPNKIIKCTKSSEYYFILLELYNFGNKIYKIS